MYFEVSAKTGENIELVFKSLCMTLGNESSMIINPNFILPSDINNNEDKKK